MHGPVAFPYFSFELGGRVQPECLQRVIDRIRGGGLLRGLDLVHELDGTFARGRERADLRSITLHPRKPFSRVVYKQSARGAGDFLTQRLEGHVKLEISAIEMLVQSIQKSVDGDPGPFLLFVGERQLPSS
jgi:hypothetical protein